MPSDVTRYRTFMITSSGEAHPGGIHDEIFKGEDMKAKGWVYKRCGCRDRVTGRRLGSGCRVLRRRGHGGWYFAIDRPAGLDGKRRRIRKGGFASRRAAERALADLRAPHPADPAARLLTTGQWLRIWLASRVSLRPATLRSYSAHVSDYLSPHLGQIPLSELSTGDVQRMFQALMRRGMICSRDMTPTTMARIHATLRAALNAAVRERHITDNPARYVELPPARRPHAVAWTDDQITEWERTGIRPPVAIWTADQTARFLHSIGGHRLYAVYHLIALRGLRRGEAAGLRWCDLDLDQGAAVINGQTQRIGGTLVASPPKTEAGRRSIALDRTTVAALRRHRESQQAELAALGTDGGGYVFTNQRGRPISPDTLTRTFNTLVAGSGLPPIRLHDLRHGAGSLALQAGADLKVIQDQLGHSSIVFTADTYVTVVPQVAHGTAEAVAQLILRAGRCAPGQHRPRRKSSSRRVVVRTTTQRRRRRHRSAA
jgi:integrase